MRKNDYLSCFRVFGCHSKKKSIEAGDYRAKFLSEVGRVKHLDIQGKLSFCF